MTANDQDTLHNAASKVRAVVEHLNVALAIAARNGLRVDLTIDHNYALGSSPVERLSVKIWQPVPESA